FVVAYGELAIAVSLVLGILVRPASICGFIYMMTLLFSANYPGPHAAFWQYFGASLDAFGAGPVLRRLRNHPERRTLETLGLAARGTKKLTNARDTRRVW